MLRRLGLLTAVGGAGTFGSAAFGSGEPTATARALVAGSLLEFANQIPGASVEAHGSVAVRRLVTDGLREPDAIALSDPRLFDGISRRTTRFATNAVVLAYDPASSFAPALDANWQTAIERDGIVIGRTDPKQDPLGYRTVMALRLAERRYDLDAQSVIESAGVYLETDLLNVLEGGKLDAAFAYRNMAVQRGLPYVELPEEIDFSSPDYDAVYRSVTYELGEETIRGSAIRYAATALTETGEPWVDRLVTATDQLRDAGFIVPSNYPIADAPVQ